MVTLYNKLIQTLALSPKKEDILLATLLMSDPIALIIWSWVNNRHERTINNELLVKSLGLAHKDRTIIIGQITSDFLPDLFKSAYIYSNSKKSVDYLRSYCAKYNKL